MLPEVVPGTLEQLVQIAHQVIGPRVNGRSHGDKARLQHVVDQVEHLGRELLHGLQQQVTSPSAKALKAQLELVRHHAQALATALAGLPFFAQDLINGAYWTQRSWPPDARSFRPRGIGPAPAATAAAAIAEAAELHLGSWQTRAIAGQVPPEQRGPMRAYQRIIGDPRTFLAQQVAELIIAEQGVAAATAEESGVVYTVIGQIWEWATGLSDEEANLRKHIRQGVKRGQIVAAHSKVQTDIEDEVTRYHAAVMADMATGVTPSSQARLAHKRRLHKLEAEQELLTRKLLRSEPGQGKPEHGGTGPGTPAQEKIVPR